MIQLKGLQNMHVHVGLPSELAAAGFPAKRQRRLSSYGLTLSVL